MISKYSQIQSKRCKTLLSHGSLTTMIYSYVQGWRYRSNTPLKEINKKRTDVKSVLSFLSLFTYSKGTCLCTLCTQGRTPFAYVVGTQARHCTQTYCNSYKLRLCLDVSPICQRSHNGDTAHFCEQLQNLQPQTPPSEWFRSIRRSKLKKELIHKYQFFFKFTVYFSVQNIISILYSGSFHQPFRKLL